MNEERNTALDWERSVIATAVQDPNSMEEAGDLLPADFTGPNQIAWAEVLALHARAGLDRRSLINALSSCPDWERMSGGVRVEDYLAEVLTFRGTNMAHYVEMVVDRSVKRALRRHAALIAAEAEDNSKSAQELLDFAEQKILALRRNRTDNELTMQDLIGIFVPRLDRQLAGHEEAAWAPHVQAIKDVIDYMEPEDFMTVAARPGEGKCLARGTKVILIDGTPKAVEEIRVRRPVNGSELHTAYRPFHHPGARDDVLGTPEQGYGLPGEWKPYPFSQTEQE